jgi:hypothetical protein
VILFDIGIMENTAYDVYADEVSIIWNVGNRRYIVSLRYLPHNFSADARSVSAMR